VREGAQPRQDGGRIGKTVWGDRRGVTDLDRDVARAESGEGIFVRHVVSTRVGQVTECSS
jgi:hypothetical protein